MKQLTTTMQSWLAQYDSKKDRYSRIGLFEWRDTFKNKRTGKMRRFPRFLDWEDMEGNEKVLRSVYFYEASATELQVFESFGPPLAGSKSVHRYALIDGEWVKEEKAMLRYIS